mmetsp:Transcript_17085/g.53361  ORF Transcript_17085/g.53361 Transcript_17085/m.53361 type:complete len:212 (+) Transcript_17085:73-708(+)
MVLSSLFGSSAPVDFKYLNFGGIGGRGGVVRFFMLANDIAYKETLITPGEEWAAAKKAMMESGENPAGTVPIVQYDGKMLTQHVAIMRQLAKDRGVASSDFANDAVADQYQAFRDAWVDAAFLGGDKEKFKEFVKTELKVFEGLYAKYGTADTYLSSPKPLWGDAALAALIRDLILTGFLTEAEIPPRLAKMYSALVAIPAIAAWIESKKE